MTTILAEADRGKPGRSELSVDGAELYEDPFVKRMNERFDAFEAKIDRKFRHLYWMTGLMLVDNAYLLVRSFL